MNEGVPPAALRQAAGQCSFAARLIRWQEVHGRHDLPWQGTRDPYRIWLSEVMLQQTQVSTVVPYYLRFVERFPDVRRLADATLDEVLTLWSGLGYYSRARNLHRAARVVVAEHGGRFPRGREALETLPGIGRSTAAAISVFAYGAREAILDGNVKRVLARHFGVEGYPGEPKVLATLWRLAESLLPDDGIERYTQGLMDLGATACVRSTPACDLCPVRGTCVARATGRCAELPAARPRRVLPQRSTVMLILRTTDEVLLEQRSPAGVWGGLWSLPEFDSTEAAVQACTTRFGCDVTEHRSLEPLVHTFTHFSLTIMPIVCTAGRRRSAANEASTKWLSVEEAARAAVPAPVRRLLEQL